MKTPSSQYHQEGPSLFSIPHFESITLLVKTLISVNRNQLHPVEGKGGMFYKGTVILLGSKDKHVAGPYKLIVKWSFFPSFTATSLCILLLFFCLS